jgi:hypothetical protein
MRGIWHLAAAALFVSASVSAQTQAIVKCGDGLSESECKLASATVGRALGELEFPVEGWRWVVVPSSEWEKVRRAFGSKSESPAFTVLAVRTTYVDGSLVFPSARDEERLLSYSKRTGTDRLRWVLAHETGHILCNSNDERVANDAAGRLEFGAHQVRTAASVCGARIGKSMAGVR